MSDSALLILEDGFTFAGQPFGARGDTYGEVVFATSMTGYQEMLTDPSYAGQILVLTYPMVGNYGINSIDAESRRIQVRGLVVREECVSPSHWESNMTLGQYLEAQGVCGLTGVDSRSLTRHLRSNGMMMGAISGGKSISDVTRQLSTQPAYSKIDFARGVGAPSATKWKDPDRGLYHIVVVDSGVKYNILRLLRSRGCHITSLPCTATAAEILSLNPDGIVLSPGPGDPALLDYLVVTTTGLVGKVPIFGICLGHQLLGRAFGAKTFKLPFGHRGANHPVKDIATGQVHITAQNHGYALDPSSLSSDVEISHLHLNDGTVEGLRHKSEPVMSIQYHSEAAPGPLDSVYMFDRFLELLQSQASNG